MKWFRNWKFTVPLILFCGILIFGFFIYHKYLPTNHFEQIDIPVLVKPSAASDQPISPSDVQDDLNLLHNKALTEQEDQSQINHSFNVLILGTDARDDELSRTDVIMVAHVDPEKKQVNLISVPRDTRVMIPGVGYTKVNHAHILGESKGGNHAGTESVMQIISDFFGISINYYVKTDFEGFERFINQIDGIDVDLDEAIHVTYSDNRVIGPGPQHLDGESALMLVRERKSLPDGDFGRQKNQALMLKALAKKLLQWDYIKQLPSLISQIKEDVIDTNFKDDDLISLAWMMADIRSDQIEYSSIPGHSDRLMDPLLRMELYYWIPDLAEVKLLSERLFK
ncbi:LytR family transcriptional regulator [Paenibacillus albiflavus]|uniref:LytR family transcriptional regulator n=1 Tax=Paenibacillus albiflavus TaxID=2545760 RepID=A0A4R4EC49_9BACL|nr:LCP family protein [Paenibacillus albiflavus]TCZ77524.1 LytR family transcriptional regulator [Paenibacillus albiflavus]